MSKYSKWPRAFGCLALLALFLLAGGTPLASAAAKPQYDLEIKKTPPDTSNPNLVGLLVMVRDADTGQVPAEKRLDKLSMNVVAEPAGGGKQTEINGCVRRSTIETAKPGLHDCAVYVSQGGEWAFTVVINTMASERAVQNEASGATLNQLVSETKTFSIVAPKLEGFNKGLAGIEGSPHEVINLQGHVIAVAAWAACAALLSFIAVPPLRRLLSDRAMTVLLVRCRTLITSLGVTCVLTVITGTVLLVNMLPYELPLSSDDAEATFGLPFGQAYFATMTVKLLTFVVMVAATVVIAMAANKRARVPAELEEQGEETDVTVDDADPWHPGASRGRGTAGGAAVAVKKRTAEELHGHLDTAPAMVAAVIFAVGLAVAGVCVTLLKYFHELIEAVKAVT